MKQSSCIQRLLVGLFLCAFCALSAAQAVVLNLASGVTATGATATTRFTQRGTKTFQAVGSTSSGSGSVTAQIQGSMDGSTWDTLGTITLTLSTTPASNGFTSDDRYEYHRANVTAISGTGAAVTVRAGF